ncbi:hypothetical protein ACM26V_12150 [Salipaludibacillus sp. HK11]|uniref:hypothetical protein n=1 Tax=Salipaludibacillus sp. HK11 TaxID=3394320 RepID=UPI0039FC230B
MLNKIPEENFLALRGPLESKRQGPHSLAGIFLLVILIQALLLGLEHYIKEYSNYPFKEEVFYLHFWFSCITIVLYIIYMIPGIYMKSQKIQYLLSIIASQNIFGISFYILSLIIIGTSIISNPDRLAYFTYLTISGAILIFIATSVRLYILLKKGYYRKGSEKDKLRNKFEKKSLIPVATVTGVLVVFMMQFLMKNVDMQDFDVIIFSTIFVLLFYTMIFILPEQLVILYCKFRFDSFNYEQNGDLKPVRDEDGTILTEMELFIRNQ